MERDEAVGQHGLLFGKAGELRGVHRLGKQRIGIGLAQRRQPRLRLTRANLAPVEREGAREALDQHRA